MTRRRMIPIGRLLGPALLAFMAFQPSASAETVFVKYRGPVDLTPFKCEEVRSSFVRRVCYDAKEHYMLISLNGVYYHYCEIPAKTVDSLLRADSIGGYYNTAVKGQYDCRVNRMPTYDR